MTFNRLYTILEGYFINNAKGFYITDDGVLHDVDGTHISQILDDYDLESDIMSEWGEYSEDEFDWDKDYDFVASYVKDHNKDNGIHFIVVDLDKRVFHVRSPESNLNKKQKKSIMNYCIKHRCELEYDSLALK